MVVLVTGAAGFIGFHTCKRLIEDGVRVIGIDSLNDYYDLNLKEARLENLKSKSKEFKNLFSFFKGDITENSFLEEIFEIYKPSKVINLAAQAGVRYSLINPDSYYNSNLIGFGNILKNCIKYKIEHFVYASSSSVYGGNTKLPLSEKDPVDHPVSLYAATKRANELIAHSYSHLYNLPSTGLRFFTVYGPWGRPDMALFLFTKSMIKGEKIDVYNNGNMVRDFTYIDDVVNSIIKVLEKPPKENSSLEKSGLSPENSWAPHKVFNVGNSKPIKLLDFLKVLEEILCVKANINYLPMQSGDVRATESDTTILEDYINYRPNTPIKNGIKEFVKWYKEFYKIGYD
ncbi:capsular biosynthesis protein CpsI [Prochlorococcus marinus str. MU1417]|nr:SDR family NAD(P)-dependent oxidoreductase [Prochlorococcus marinus]MBO8221413.1 SDR family NAD(P)-dependent oxidoreductase [Prochlorococcus marinus CUG1417]MBW3074223.1 capsular biosynthesis protein CpsI [Prochlorococcus marinus str. MU1417]